MRILITGGQGQLAADLVRTLQGDELGDRVQVTALDRRQLDITQPSHIDAAITCYEPGVIINAAAFHQVDVCEDEPEQSFAINAAAPQRLAVACRRHDILLVHLSTDYVFNGQQRRPYKEDDPVDPISVYGASKAAGEMAIRCTTERHLIVRTTGLYGHRGMSSRHGNFVETMLRLADTGQQIAVVGNQTLTPSATQDVAEVIGRLIHRDLTGTYHVTNSGQCSWYEFAAEVFRLASVPVDLIRTTQEERPTRARRPAYSVLAYEGLRRAGIPEPRPWQEALANYIAARPAYLQSAAGARSR